MQFDIITIFPRIFDSYFNESILKRARKNGLIDINIHNLRDYTTDKRKTVDDTPYGGGAGMVLKIESIYKCVQSLKSKIRSRKLKVRIVLFSAKGKKYTQKDAKRLSKYDQLIFICGRYEGVDERVAKYIADEEISIGDYVLTGGEIPAMIVADSVSRIIPGVLGNNESTKIESHSKEGYLEFPQYTKPEIFNKWKVPKILLSGNHKEIEKWRKKNSKQKLCMKSQ
ncbi:MAG TPA: tRNA (guanosine(37)-N1)-methyltransferase TrmD [Candidatus Moranbacteria bacterium]|nr:tRNA (guanosine(37)-N1)-methyltransferase TrmD [Candidatus Moranbacteria bacterium]HRZ33750.1 tRNA (guanosine(37)-N1)-methyltransferase TrmD [Candidatus Moranbacteria bacterium]